MCSNPGICEFLDSVASTIAYTPFMQFFVSASGFFRRTDSFGFEVYKLFNWYLPRINNEVEHADKALYKERFQSLDRIMLLMFTKDVLVVPTESAFFGEQNA